MTNQGLEVTTLENTGDVRGDSYYVEAVSAFLGTVREVHFTTTRPGFVRGNHYHRGRREAILVVFTDTWRLAWRTLETQETAVRDFEGAGSVIIRVMPETVHAIQNTGCKDLHVVSFSNTPFNPDAPDTFPLILLS